MTDLGHIIGIDLGTTNSVVAAVENDQPVVLMNSEGSTRTPSVVAFGEDPTAPPVVGELAKRQAVLNPERTIASIKRLMGRSLADIEPWRKDLPYALTEEDGRLMISVGGVGYTPAQISAFILKKLKEAAEAYFGQPVDKAVVAVPAYFDDLQRQATYEAAELAGLKVLRLLNEPTAAAMAYGLGRGSQERVAVYDFGGGTFDLTILDISGNTFEVLTSVGDTHLGGDDIDALLLERLLAELRKRSRDEYRPDALVLQRLREAAEKAKCELSYARLATISLPFIGYVDGEPLHLEMTVRRSELEEMIRPLIDRTLECCQRALESCGLRAEDLDRIVLVGGTTRIPAVQQAVEDFFGIAPYKGINPDEIVAIGAAMQGAILQGQLKEVVLLDVTPHSLGVEIEGGKVSRVVEKNSTIPIEASKLFTTTEDNQEVVVVHVVQGEGEKAAECRSLGKFLLSGIQKARAGIPRIQVTFHINADGMVEVSAQDLATQEHAGITVAVTPYEEGEQSEGRRRRPRRGAAREATEIIPAPEAAQAGPAQLNVERQAAPGYEPHSAGETAPLAPRPLSSTHVEKAPAPTAAQPAASAAFDQLRTMIEPFSLPDPSSLPCSPATRTLLEELRNAGLWSDAVPAARLKQPWSELRAVTSAAAEKPGVWPWYVYLSLLRGELGEACRALLAWARSPAPDRGQAYAMAETLETQFGAHPMIATAKASVLAGRNELAEALATLAPWVREAEPPRETCELFIELASRRTEGSQDQELQSLVARALVALGRYDDAMRILEPLAMLPEQRITATKLLAICCWKKGMLYLAWQKLQELPMSDEIKALCYDLASDCEAIGQRDVAREIYALLAGSTRPFREARERLTRLGATEATTPAPQTSAELGAVAAAFADSRFVILDEINRGSMGVIYRARDKVLDEVVALKVLNDYLASDPTSLERFKREARAAKRLSHPNIVRIHDMYEIGPKRLLSMEYIPGRDVKTIIREHGPLPCAEVVRIATAVARALAYAHKLQIVHRDIKPANIMIAEDGSIKVTDFGIAKFLLPGPDATRSGSQIVGTPLYMAPEQIKGTEVDARADLYSLGVTIYEMISGVPPFYEGNIEYHHLHSQPPPLRVEVPLELADIVLKCLAKDPALRFQSAEELVTALESVECAGNGY
jgi:molecular chaperone DnaK